MVMSPFKKPRPKTNLDLIRRYFERNGMTGPGVSYPIPANYFDAVGNYETALIPDTHECDVIQRLSEAWRELGESDKGDVSRKLDILRKAGTNSTGPK